MFTKKMLKEDFRDVHSSRNSATTDREGTSKDNSNDGRELNSQSDSPHQPFITIQPHHHDHYSRSNLHHHQYHHRSTVNSHHHHNNDSNQSFEMVPLTVLTPYKCPESSSSSLLMSGVSTPQSSSPSPKSPPSSLKRSNSSGGNLDYYQSARSSDFGFLDESEGKRNEKSVIGYGDSYMLMWCPWYSMYNNLFVEFWMVRMSGEEECVVGGNSDQSDDHNMRNCRLLPIKQASKSSVSERFPTGNFWSYSVGVETVRGRENVTNQGISTHYFGSELEDLIICFFGVTKIMKFKLNVIKTKNRDRKTSTISEFVTGIESVEFVELIDYDYLSRKSPLDAYSSWDSFPDDDDEIDSENAELTQDIYQSLFRSSSTMNQTLKTGNIPRVEFVHNDSELNFVKCDNEYNFNIYSMRKRRVEDHGNNSPLSLDTPPTPHLPCTTLSITQKSSIDLSKSQSLSILFFQKQTTRKVFNKAKSPTSGRFELRSSHCLKTGFETIGDIIPFELDSSGGISRLIIPNQYLKFCKFDENMFFILEIDPYLLKKHEKVAEFGVVNKQNHVCTLPKFFKLYILDLTNHEDVKIKNLTNVKKQQTSPKLNTTDKFSLRVEESKFIPTYRHQKSKRVQKPTFTFEHEDIFNMIVFKQDPHNNPHQYTLAIFYKGIGDRYQFNGDLSDQSSLKGHWFEYVHFTHVSWSKYKTLFDQANFMNRADPSLISNLGFIDIYFILN